MIPVSDAPHASTTPVDRNLVTRVPPPASAWAQAGQPAKMTVRELRDWYIRERTGSDRPASGDLFIDDMPVATLTPALFSVAAANMAPSEGERLKDVLRNALHTGQKRGFVDPNIRI